MPILSHQVTKGHPHDCGVFVAIKKFKKAIDIEKKWFLSIDVYEDTNGFWAEHREPIIDDIWKRVKDIQNENHLSSSDISREEIKEFVFGT